MPEGSELSLRVTGGSGEETLVFTDAAGNAARDRAAGRPAARCRRSRRACADGVDGRRQFAGKLTADGMLSLKSGDSELKAWAFAVTPDKPPVIRFSGEPKRAVNGALELTYEIEDDYGAASAEAEFALERSAGQGRAAALQGAGDEAHPAAPRRQGRRRQRPRAT